jgi:hypothetical protein
MKTSSSLLATIFWLGAMTAAQAQGTPKIQFERTVYDFGKTSQVASVSGVFKYKNVGDGILKIEPPKPSCGCTVAELKPDKLEPGASGELPFTLNLGVARANMEKHIAIKSNDPLTPEVSLAIKVDYTPLYDLSPTTLAPVLGFGTNTTTQFTTLSRTDGKPLRITRVDASKPWITATVEPGATGGATNARIRVAIQRKGAPGRFNEYVHVYAADQTNSPVSSIYIYGQVKGEISVTPEALYWSITDSTNTTDRPEAMVLRRVKIQSADGKPIELKNPQSSVKGLKVELVSSEAGKVYELVARLDQLPTSTISGNVSFETSVASQARIELPVIVNVFKK